MELPGLGHTPCNQRESPQLKRRMSRLVGHLAEQPGDLRTCAAYDVAYRTIYQALPDCRGRCACTCFLG
jgi:hypothetical protein